MASAEALRREVERMALSKESLLDFIHEQLKVDTTTLDETSKLCSSGVIDSGGMLQLVAFVESEGNVEFSTDDMTLDHVDSIDRILRFVAQRVDP